MVEGVFWRTRGEGLWSGDGRGDSGGPERAQGVTLTTHTQKTVKPTSPFESV
jgi:hypothetical protein